MPMTCVQCKRWKLFGDTPCAAHPDFETERERVKREERAKWAEAEENFNAMMFVAALRTTSAMGRTDFLQNAWRNLQQMPESLQKKVQDELERRGLMTAEELTDSLLFGLVVRRNAGSDRFPEE